MRRSSLCCAIVVFAVGCDGGEPTGSTCPTTDPPTFQNFGDQFFETYCRECHSSTSTNRHDAPGSENYDTETDIRLHAKKIDMWAAAGPNATNTDMPELEGSVDMAPTDAERRRLGEFLACLQQ